MPFRNPLRSRVAPPLAAALVFATGAGAGQDPRGESRPSPQGGDAAHATFDAALASQGIVVDRGRGLVAVKGKFCAPKQPLEYLITAPHGSHYESLVAIEARPSRLAAALLSIGVKEEGKMPLRKPKQPKPSDAELAAGALLYEVEPATGDRIHIYIEWNDDRGFQRHRLESLVFERPEGRTIPNDGFVFINSTILTPRNAKESPAYAADVDGDFLGCSAGGSPVLVVPKPHPYATEGDFEIYQPNWTLVPSEPLPVVVILSKSRLDAPLFPNLATPESAPASAPAVK